MVQISTENFISSKYKRPPLLYENNTYENQSTILYLSKCLTLNYHVYLGEEGYYKFRFYVADVKYHHQIESMPTKEFLIHVESAIKKSGEAKEETQIYVSGVMCFTSVTKPQ